jgi:RNA polymerase sigma factor (sigma-70 family)
MADGAVWIAREIRSEGSEAGAKGSRGAATEWRGEDWAAVIEQMLCGDCGAHLKLARLVTGFLARWRAYDFQDDWADLVHEVLFAVIRAARKGRVEKPGAWFAYVRATTHHKLMDRLRTHLRHGEDQSQPAEGPDGLCPIPVRIEARQEIVADVRSALERLPERTRWVVYAFYARGLTYAQVAGETRIPLGSVRRYVREGMAALRLDFTAKPNLATARAGEGRSSSRNGVAWKGRRPANGAGRAAPSRPLAP